jgi:dTDP-4-dehydrorhamnose 3,5-epimerase
MGERMKFTETPLSGAYCIELEPFQDERGIFARTFCQKEFQRIGFNKQIVQINCSASRQTGTIRGLHYQIPPACETKIIRCIQGRIFDVMVDIRAGSPTLMRWYGVELSKDNLRMVYIPEGFAHGFQTLTDNAEIIYMSSAFYCPEYENGLRFDDPALAIRWPLPPVAVSPKDQNCSFIGRDFKGIEIR